MMNNKEYIESLLQRENEYRDAVKHKLPRVAAARIRYIAKLYAGRFGVPYKQALEGIVSKYKCETKYL